MNHMPMVSIITPSYNQGEFIEDTILSIKAQTYTNFEHIVVDAGSNDNTIDILNKYEGTYDLTWLSEPDEGMYQAINKGLRRSKGEILCYLNTDDLYLPWTLEAVVEYFDNNKRLDLLYGDVILLDNDKQTFELTFCPPFNLKWAKCTGGLYQPTVFWSRHAYEKVGGFDERLRFVGDYEYWLRIAERGLIKKLNEFLAVDRLQYQAKRFLSRDLLEKELSEVRDRYAAKDIISSLPRKVQKYFFQFYSLFWTRYYMFLFLKQIGTGHQRSNVLWSHLFSVKDIRIPSARSLLIRLLPFLGKHKGPWLVSNLPIGLNKVTYLSLL